MELSDVDKEDIIYQLSELSGEQPIFYLKFVKESDFADDLTNGIFYANTPEYFRKLEIETGERGQGDAKELLAILDTYNVKLIGYEDSNFKIDIPKAKVTLQYKSDNEIPMICFIGVRIKDLELISANKTQAEFKLPFSAEELKKMKDKFGKYCVALETAELVKNIDNYSIKNIIAYEFRKIEYCHQQTKERVEAFVNSSVNRFFYKDEDLAYQNEYRLIFGMSMPEDHKIRLGKFHNNVAKIKCEDLSNFRMVIPYKLELKK